MTEFHLLVRISKNSRLKNLQMDKIQKISKIYKIATYKDSELGHRQKTVPSGEKFDASLKPIHIRQKDG